MDGASKKKEKGLIKITILNWIGTLILCAIPGVNVVALLAFLIFSKAQAKKSFAAAVLILMILTAILVCAVFLIFPDQLADLASQLRGTVQSAPVENGVLIS